MIQKTNNYEQFKELKGNRNLNAGHLARLTMSIGKKNLMEYNPILVNENMEVVDGQHRLEVARQNKLPVYFQIVPASGLNEVMELNTNLRNWKLVDFVDSLIVQGNKTMMYLREFCDEYNLSITGAIMAHTGGRSSTSKGGSFLRLQKISFTDEQKETAHKAADLHFDLRSYVNRKGTLPHSILYACWRIAQERKDRYVSEAVKNRGKIISISNDQGEMYTFSWGI